MATNKRQNGYEAEVCVRIGGKEKRRQALIKFEDHPELSVKEVKQLADETAVLLRKQILTDAGLSENRDRSIEDLWNYYSASTEYLQLADETRANYSDRAKCLLRWCAKQGLSRILAFAPAHAQEFQDYLYRVSHTGKSPETMNDIVKLAWRLFDRELIRSKRIIQENPFDAVEKLAVEPTEVRWFSDEELRAIFAELKLDWSQHVFPIFYLSGMRTKELRYLELSKLAPDLSSIRIEKSNITTFKPKGTSTRTLPCNDAIKPHLDFFRWKNKGKLFVIDGDAPVNKSMFYGHYKRTIIPLVHTSHPELNISDTNVHSFRKTCGSHMLQKGVPIAYVSKYLGHSSIAVTEKHYARLFMDNLIYAANALTIGNLEPVNLDVVSQAA